MSKTLAIILSVIGGLFLLGLIVVGGFVYWFYQHNAKLIETVGNINKTVEDAKKEAKEFGVKTNNEGCLSEALARHKRDQSITGRISTQGFLTVCLQVSEHSPGFCDGVPAQKEIMKSVSWRLKKCSDAGLQNDQGCQQIFGAVQTYCNKNAHSPGK
jgi:hypothetical protein